MRFCESVPKPDRGAIQQIADLKSDGNKVEAALIKAMVATPQAVWFEGGTPRDVRQDVRNTVKRAQAKKVLPVLVVYNLPYRDCSRFSAGGAAGTEEYLAWIEGFAAGIGKAEVIVILEPDGLGIIPWYTTINGELEWCQPAVGDASLAAARFTELNAAVDRIKEQPRASVYLDGTHSGWLGVGDLSDRLIKAGVERADGFFVNVSNYQEQRKLEKYGTWTSQCLYLAEQLDWWNVAWCASQYFPANPADFDTWVLTDQQYVQDYANAGLAMPTASEATHFVVDTSRKRARPLDAAGRPPAGRPAGLVQPARPRPRAASDHRDAGPADRRVPLGQDPGRVRRRVHPMGAGRRHRPRPRARRPAGRRVVPRAGARTGAAAAVVGRTARPRSSSRSRQRPGPAGHAIGGDAPEPPVRPPPSSPGRRRRSRVRRPAPGPPPGRPVRS